MRDILGEGSNREAVGLQGEGTGVPEAPAAAALSGVGRPGRLEQREWQGLGCTWSHLVFCTFTGFPGWGHDK